MNANEVAPQWWITTDALASGGEKILGPFATKELAFEVRRYVELAEAPRTFWVDQDGPEAERKLALIGRDLALVESLAKQVNRQGLSGHAATGLSKTGDGRGFAFDVQVHHGGKSTGRGLCSCGAESPELESDAERKRWHRDVHKPAVRAATSAPETGKE